MYFHNLIYKIVSSRHISLYVVHLLSDYNQFSCSVQSRCVHQLSIAWR
jgi:hypothetical protein